MSSKTQHLTPLTESVFTQPKIICGSEWNVIMKSSFVLDASECNYDSMLYAISEENDPYTKIGQATNPFQRIRALQQGNRRILYTHKIWCDPDPKFISFLEKAMHEYYNETNLASVTGQTCGHTEWFITPPNTIIQYIDSIFDEHRTQHYSRKMKVAQAETEYKKRFSDFMVEA